MVALEAAQDGLTGGDVLPVVVPAGAVVTVVLAGGEAVVAAAGTVVVVDVVGGEVVVAGAVACVVEGAAGADVAGGGGLVRGEAVVAVDDAGLMGARDVVVGKEVDVAAVGAEVTVVVGRATVVLGRAAVVAGRALLAVVVGGGGALVVAGAAGAVVEAGVLVLVVVVGCGRAPGVRALPVVAGGTVVAGGCVEKAGLPTTALYWRRSPAAKVTRDDTTGAPGRLKLSVYWPGATSSTSYSPNKGMSADVTRSSLLPEASKTVTPPTPWPVRGRTRPKTVAVACSSVTSKLALSARAVLPFGPGAVAPSSTSRLAVNRSGREKVTW